MARPEPPQPQQVLEILKERSPLTRIAVVGASNDPEKYGNIIVKNLAAKGYTVIPVNPREETIAGIEAHGSLASIQGPVHIVTFVTPPKVTRKVLEQVAQLHLPNVWLQDGSYDREVLDFAASAPFLTVYEACIMVMSNYD